MYKIQIFKSTNHWNFQVLDEGQFRMNGTFGKVGCLAVQTDCHDVIVKYLFNNFLVYKLFEKLTNKVVGKNVLLIIDFNSVPLGSTNSNFLLLKIKT